MHDFWGSKLIAFQPLLDIQKPGKNIEISTDLTTREPEKTSLFDLRKVEETPGCWTALEFQDRRQSVKTAPRWFHPDGRAGQPGIAKISNFLVAEMNTFLRPRSRENSQESRSTKERKKVAILQHEFSLCLGALEHEAHVDAGVSDVGRGMISLPGANFW